jgi:5'-phosphate synthase pdxT subunit
MIKIGILDLQGAVSEHYDIMQIAIKNMGIDGEVTKVRYSDEVAKCDGLIISGGESTVIGKLIKERGIDKVIYNNQIPVFGTCAGMVLLSKEINHDQDLLGLMDIKVKRNAFGSQRESFEKEIDILGDKFPGVFIRAPSIVEILNNSKENSDDIEILAKLDSDIIAIKQAKNIAVSFHPELTTNTRLHEYFLNELLNNK